MGINNPVPRSLKQETKKAAKVLANFIKPNQMLGVDQVIPPEVLQNAKGLAIITVFKAGFLFSGRAGSGVIVARLPDGYWSPPSAIATAGAGAGGQVGIELTDFVFILNTREAVESFAQAGSMTFGGNISVAAGPLGRNAEAGGTASLKTAAAIFAYSKTKGLFAGVSVEGSAIVERREANRKFYGNNCKAKQILSGRVEAPPACEPLFRVLDSRAFTKRSADYSDEDGYYSDIPDFNSDTTSDSFDSDRRSSRRGIGSSRYGSARKQRNYSDDDNDDEDTYPGSSRARRNTATKRESVSDDDDDDYYSSRRSSRFSSSAKPKKKGSSWEDDVYDRYDSPRSRNYDSPKSKNSRASDEDLNSRFARSRISDKKPSYNSAPSSSSRNPKAIALYSFTGEQNGDLPFKKGDVIAILKKSESTNDWWTGKVNGKEGIFPANYVELV